MSNQQPLYDRKAAPTDRLTDLVLLLADADGATYATVREQLEGLDLEAFPIEFDEPIGAPVAMDDYLPERRQPHQCLDFLDAVGYLEEYYVPVDVDEELALTREGRDGAAALLAGLDDEQAAALREVGIDVE